MRVSSKEAGLTVPEDTEGIFIPSVFVSRASFLLLMDLLRNGTDVKEDGMEGDLD